MVVVIVTALRAGATDSADGQYATATVVTGSINQTLPLVGTVAAANDAIASFPISGTVATTTVAVGDQVKAGQTLATLDAHGLQESVDSARASLLRAQTTLESASSTGSSTAPAGNGSTTRSGGSSGQLAGIIRSLSTLLRPVQAAQAQQQLACQAVLGSSSTRPTGAPTGRPTSPTSSPASPTSSPTSPTSSPTSPTSSPSTTSSPTSPTSSPSTTKPSRAELAACVGATGRLVAAENGALVGMAQAGAALQRAAASVGSTSSSGAQSGGAGAGTRAGSSANAQVAVLQAQQSLDSATMNLSGAVLKAPIAGVVAIVPFSAGDRVGTSAGIEIVGPGAAIVSTSVPLSRLPSIAVGQAVEVNVGGSVTPVAGTVSLVGSLPDSISGSAPTYPVRIVVPEPTTALASGAHVDVEITISTVSGVLVIPVSAVTPLSTSTGSVVVLADGVPTATPVSTGAVGAGLVEIRYGLSAGQVVVLADRNATLPTSTNPFRGLSGGGGQFGRSRNGTPGNGGGAGGRPGG